jgi:hypothetical protein
LDSGPKAHHLASVNCSCFGNRRTIHWGKLINLEHQRSYHFDRSAIKRDIFAGVDQFEWGGARAARESAWNGG